METTDLRQGSITFRETRRRLAADSMRIRSMLRARFGCAPMLMIFDQSYQCVLLHRLSHYFWRRGARKSARLCMQLNSMMTGADFHPNCDIGGGLLVPNPVTIAASGNAGANLTLMPLSGIGMLPREKDIGAGPGVSLLGNDVWMGAGSGVLGPVRIGSGTRVDPGSSLTRMVPGNSLVEMQARPIDNVVDLSGPRASSATPLHSCDHASFQATLHDLDRDILRYLEIREGFGQGPHGLLRKLSALLTTEMMGVAIYRLSHYGQCSGKHWLARAAYLLNQLLYRLSIEPRSCLGGGLFLPHPAGALVSAHAGENVTLYVRTICASGSPARIGPEYGPRMGHRVLVSGMGAAFGPISVGDDVRIGFNIQLGSDALPGHSAASAMMRTKLATHTDVGLIDYVPRPQARRSLGFSEMRALLLEDRQQAVLVCEGQMQWMARAAVTLFRYGTWLWAAGYARLARATWRFNMRLTGADLDPRSEIAGGFVVPNPAGVSVHCRAGRNLTVLALACIGPANAKHPIACLTSESPELGESVLVSEHASLSGPIRVGDAARIGPGCKITWDIAAGADLVMPAPRLRQVANVESEEEV